MIGILALAASTTWADVFVLKDGDRVTGSISGETKNSIIVKSAYGPLTIPRGRILRIIKDDGSDRAFTVPRDLGAPTPAPTPTPPPPNPIVLTVGGTTFWHAWEEKDAPEDTSLRLVVSLDEQPVATFTDPVVEPGEIKGAILNSFGFDRTKGFAGVNGASVAAPDIQPGRITLRIESAAATPGDHSLRMSYQINAGTKEAPEWRDVATTGVQVSVKADGPTLLRAQQDAGKVAFEGRGRRTMKNLDTFRLGISPSP